ncbi:hypothetical protein BHAOGJBA_3970 [Methylobacterium hispanicum]|jgi:hypothetical protein|uniref:Uncharacterized protein n=1 Tax=Methylobacterium hispanicum TaxID=270350 RepID=A0AAV4ZRC3_9HYPH|nr:hypothetical protein BHAOGJBA_3969 [Methylobacterium hispanicum]GJD90431.1 hypothetical protein BHAOGJBA_3970 [Methylobacterium hispanicum]
MTKLDAKTLKAVTGGNAAPCPPAKDPCAPKGNGDKSKKC